MREVRLILLVLASAGAGAAHPRAAAAQLDAGICARCHATQAELAAREGGHAPSLDCVTCHEERRPGSFGRRHRTVPKRCTTHHATSVETHPPATRPLGRARLRRSCLECHEPHGSANAHLVRSAIRKGLRLRPIDFDGAGGAVAGGFVNPARPGRGLCETCHRTTRFYPANGRGEDHFTEDCGLCHDHAAGFRPVITDASCAICHADEAARLAKGNRHHDRFAGRCSSCHAEATAEPGPGHRASSDCADCHAPRRVARHVPPNMPVSCTQCHEPHGTDNIRLIRDAILTPRGVEEPVRLATLAGRADGGLASASAPGTGLCEICHTRTRFYRADGGAAAHFTTACGRCHPHAAGFLPR
jgi:predicted CXXCH cytochrome family protein